MKFAAFCLALLSFVGATEVDLIQQRKDTRIQHGAVKEGLCHNKPLNANMLIQRVRSFSDVLSVLFTMFDND